MARWIVRPVLALAGLALVGWALMTSWPRPVVVQLPDTSGREPRQEDAVYENGWNVANPGEATFADFFLRYHDLLGEPVSGFDGRCQAFRFGRLCFNPANPTDWQVQLSNSGLEDMQVEGYTPKPGASPHPAVRDWIYSQLEAGTDVVRLVGRTISDPVCDQRTHMCTQWTDKQRFLFREDAVSGAEVRRGPVGLWLTHPQLRNAVVAPPATDLHRSLPVLVVGTVMVLLTLASLMGRGTSSASRLPI